MHGGAVQGLLSMPLPRSTSPRDNSRTRRHTEFGIAASSVPGVAVDQYPGSTGCGGGCNSMTAASERRRSIGNTSTDVFAYGGESCSDGVSQVSDRPAPCGQAIVGQSYAFDSRDTARRRLYLDTVDNLSTVTAGQQPLDPSSTTPKSAVLGYSGGGLDRRQSFALSEQRFQFPTASLQLGSLTTPAGHSSFANTPSNAGELLERRATSVGPEPSNADRHMDRVQSTSVARSSSMSMAGGSGNPVDRAPTTKSMAGIMEHVPSGEVSPSLSMAGAAAVAGVAGMESNQKGFGCSSPERDRFDRVATSHNAVAASGQRLSPRRDRQSVNVSFGGSEQCAGPRGDGAAANDSSVSGDIAQGQSLVANGTPGPHSVAGCSSGMMLDRRFGPASGELDACQFALLKVSRVVGFFRQQVFSATEGRAAFDSMAQLVRELADALDAEVRSAASGTGAIGDVGVGFPATGSSRNQLDNTFRRAGSPGPPLAMLGHQGSPGQGSYDVLRRSLQDAQRRCEALTAEMQRQAHLNDDLTSSLASTKDGNRRLTEQVKHQSEEIATLARNRIADEERFEDVRRRYRADEEAREKDSQRRIADAVEAADARCYELQRKFSMKIHLMRSRLEKVLRECGRLRDDNLEHRRAVQSCNDLTRQMIQQAERAFTQRAEDFVKRQLEMQMCSSDLVRDLEVRIATEREMHTNEVTSWSHRHALLSAERDDLQARLARDVGQLSAKVQASERAREEERASMLEERSHQQRRAEELAHHAGTHEVASGQLREHLAREEAARGTLEQERQDNQAMITDLKRQIRESVDALASAELSNSNLREQLEEQRRRLTDQADRELTTHRERTEDRISRICEQNQADLSRERERNRQFEEQVALIENQLTDVRSKADGHSEDATSLRRALEQHREEINDHHIARKATESHLGATKAELAEERARLQAQVDSLEIHRRQLDSEVQSQQARLYDETRCHAEHHAKHERLCGALETSVQERQVRIEEGELRLLEVRQAVAEVTAEANVHKQRAAALQASLERTTQEAFEERRILEDERRRLEDAITNHVKTASESQEQYERWCESHINSLRQVQDESMARVTALDSDKEVCRTELLDRENRLVETQTRLDAAEQDLSRIRYLLNESQTTVNHVRQEKLREENDHAAAREQLQQELKQVSSALENALRIEVTLTQKIEETSVRQREERFKLESQIEDTKRTSDANVNEREQRLERMRAEYDSRINSAETRYASEMERERLRSEAVARENDQLRKFLADQRKSSAHGMTSLQTQLESHIMRLQQHTNELRGDLGRTTVPTSSSPRPRPASHSPSRYSGQGIVLSPSSQAICNGPGMSTLAASVNELKSIVSSQPRAGGCGSPFVRREQHQYHGAVSASPPPAFVGQALLAEPSTRFASERPRHGGFTGSPSGLPGVSAPPIMTLLPADMSGNGVWPGTGPSGLGVSSAAAASGLGYPSVGTVSRLGGEGR
eukprot:TRINITY_DN15786_c0_g1_i1.p1 TRINITY_DN15786_c0_g1~~TRINITY_DN15786_c0_g1_i1.p1  ORF type:complete len:1478 (+),score=300.18 TRINITY_DN15786_c0_g1_i1:138-4571(+)